MKLSKWPRIASVSLLVFISMKTRSPAPSLPTEGQVLIPVPPLVAAKLTINSAMREKGITKQALGQKLGIGEDAVRKLLDPNSRTHFTQVEKALRAVGRSLIVEDAPITEPARIPVAG